MKDLEVDRIGDYLDGKNITVCVTGGIAAMEAPKVIRQLRRYGAETRVILSNSAREHFGTTMFEWASNNEVITELTGKAEHIRQDDAALILPATLNTIGEVVNGMAHGAVSTYLSSAIGSGTPITIIPTMHDSMYNNPFFQKNLEELLNLDNVNIVGPRFNEGKAKAANKREIVAEVVRSASTDSLRGKQILITAGPTREYIDPVRFVTNMSSGRLGLDIANDLYLRGADVKVIFGPGKAVPEDYLDVTRIKTSQQMLDACLSELSENDYDVAIFAAAVSDYVPEVISMQKIRSKKDLSVSFRPTKKIIKEVDSVKKSNGKKLFKVGFKLETANSDEELIGAGLESLLNNKCHLVVANNLREIGDGTHHAYLVTPEGGYTEVHSKPEIVSSLAHELGIRTNSTFYHTVFSDRNYDISDIVEPMQTIGKKLSDLGIFPPYKEGTYGNFSTKIGAGFVITGRAIDKGHLQADDIVVVESVDHKKREK